MAQGFACVSASAGARQGSGNVGDSGEKFRGFDYTFYSGRTHNVHKSLLHVQTRQPP